MRLLLLASRNLLRAKRRNVLAGGTMLLGCAALVIAMGLADGISRQLTSSLVALQTGHVQVVVRPADYEAQNSPFDAYGLDRLPRAEALARSIEAAGGDVGVASAVPYLHARGTAVAGNRSSPVVLIGVIPEREKDLARVQRPARGGFLPPGDDQAIYVASPLAAKLRIGVGDPVSFVVQTPQGAVNSLDGVVCGIFDKGAPWFDNTAYVSLGAAQGLMDWPGAATNIKVSLRSEAARARRKARGEIEGLVGHVEGLAADARVRVETVEQAGRFSFAIVQANGSAIVVLSTFLFLAAAVGVVNGMLMSVHERTREIGTIRALGMRRGLVVRLFLLEGFALGLVAAALGVLAGGAAVLYWGGSGIPMNNITLAWMAGGDRLFPVLTPISIAIAMSLIVSISTLAALYPAFTASRLSPREALQHV